MAVAIKQSIWLAAAGLLILGGAFFLWQPTDFSRLEQKSALVITADGGEVLIRLPAQTNGARDLDLRRARWVQLADIDAFVVQVLLASEDQTFFEHGGVDTLSVLRASYLNLTGHKRYGASTLTMQLARMTHSVGMARSVWQKVREMRIAWAIEKRFSKAAILEQYLNRASFGRGAVGIEAAAQRYFGKGAKTLSRAEILTLMVLPRGPSYYDPIKYPERVKKRRAHLIKLLTRQGRLSASAAASLKRSELSARVHPWPSRAPHFSDWVLAEVSDDAREKGGVVKTSLDLALQQALHARVAAYVERAREKDGRQAAAVILDAGSSRVLAMVGSSDYQKHAINMATWRRYPGSALKPFVYATAIEKLGHHPGTVAYDVIDISKSYRPANGREFGPVAYRQAVASSMNFAAVHVIEEIGVPAVMNALRTSQVAELTQPSQYYGSRLALGSTKVRLVDLAAGYRVFVHGGVAIKANAIETITRNGEVVENPVLSEHKVLSVETAWLMTSMLSDASARSPMFGYDLPTDLPYKVVAKTGTAEGFADTVAVFCHARVDHRRVGRAARR